MKKLFLMLFCTIGLASFGQTPVKTRLLTADTALLKNLTVDPVLITGYGSLFVKNDSLHFESPVKDWNLGKLVYQDSLGYYLLRSDTLYFLHDSDLQGIRDTLMLTHATTDLDKFVVDSAGRLKYRTGAELLSDLGAMGSIDTSAFVRLGGRSGGQSVVGGIGANDDLTLNGTSNATKTTSYVNLATTGGAVNIGTATGATGYLINNAGFYNSATTVNQSTHPSVNATQTALTLQDGSAYTGTDLAMTTTYIATVVTASGSHTMGDYEVRIKESADITNYAATLTGYLYSDNSGVPGTLLATGLAIRYGTITSSYQILSVGTAYTMVSGTNYWLVLKQSTATTGGNIVLDSNVSADMGATSSDGVSWTKTTGRLRYIIRGKTYYGAYISSTNSYGAYISSTNNIGAAIASTNNIGAYISSTNNIGAAIASTNSYGAYISSTNFIGAQISSTNNIGAAISSTNSYGAQISSTNNIGAAISSTNSYGAYISSTNFIGAAIYQTGTLTTANGSNTVLIRRYPVTNSTGSLNCTGNVLQITDNPTGTGVVSGALVSGSIDNVTRLNFDPRVASGSTAVAYMVDTKNNLSATGAKLFSIRNSGTEMAAIGYDGEIQGGNVTLSQGSNRTIKNAQATSQDAGYDLTIQAGEAKATSVGEGGYLNLKGGAGYLAGGDVRISGGQLSAGGYGNVYLGHNGTSYVGKVQTATPADSDSTHQPANTAWVKRNFLSVGSSTGGDVYKDSVNTFTNQNIYSLESDSTRDVLGNGGRGVNHRFETLKVDSADYVFSNLRMDSIGKVKIYAQNATSVLIDSVNEGYMNNSKVTINYADIWTNNLNEIGIRDSIDDLAMNTSYLDVPKSHTLYNNIDVLNADTAGIVYNNQYVYDSKFTGTFYGNYDTVNIAKSDTVYGKKSIYNIQKTNGFIENYNQNKIDTVDILYGNIFVNNSKQIGNIVFDYNHLDSDTVGYLSGSTNEVVVNKLESGTGIESVLQILDTCGTAKGINLGIHSSKSNSIVGIENNITSANANSLSLQTQQLLTTGNAKWVYGDLISLNNSGSIDSLYGINLGSFGTGTAKKKVGIHLSGWAGGTRESYSILADDGNAWIKDTVRAGTLRIDNVPVSTSDTTLVIDHDIVKYKITSSGLSGSGSTNRVAKFTGSSTIGDSHITDNGSSVVISTATEVPSIKITTGAGSGKMLVSDSDGNATWQASTTIVRDTAVVLSYTDISQLYSSPKELLPAPASGYAIEVISATMKWSGGASPYTCSDTHIHIGSTTNTSNSQCLFYGPWVNTPGILYYKAMIDSDSMFGMVVPATHLIAYTDSDPTGGTGSAKIYLTYRIIDL